MKRSRETKSVALVLAIAVLLVLGITGVALAYDIKETKDGCWKIDNLGESDHPSDRDYMLGDSVINVEIYDTGDENWAVDWSWVSGPKPSSVAVKGATGENNYGGGTGGTGLNAPVNASGKHPEISHITFCFEEETTTTTLEEESSTTSTTTQEESSTTTAGQTTVSEIQTGAGGSTGLGAGTWALGFLALALAGGLGWTALRPALKKK
jgi:hypothetical protein